ncbi:MAG TPA: hypothetical protein IAC34_05565 [Candidatus Coprenecus stercoripullorum]|nr:hypothetical protein [Candidatus Coprenecus stercoripullorum]
MIKVHDTYDYDTIFTAEDARVYAELTGDMNPIHLDKAFAMQSEFGRPVAQGVLILCAFAKVFGTMWPADKYAYFISQDVTYLKPVFIDEPYHIRFECTNVDYKRMIGTIVGIMKDQDGNEIVKTDARIFSREHFSAPRV